MPPFCCAASEWAWHWEMACFESGLCSSLHDPKLDHIPELKVSKSTNMTTPLSPKLGGQNQRLHPEALDGGPQLSLATCLKSRMSLQGRNYVSLPPNAHTHTPHTTQHKHTHKHKHTPKPEPNTNPNTSSGRSSGTSTNTSTNTSTGTCASTSTSTSPSATRP